MSGRQYPLLTNITLYDIMLTMFRPYRRILHEVGDACDYVQENGGSMPWDAVSQQTEAGEPWAELPDHASARDMYDDELSTVAPNVIRVATVKEFALVFKALGAIHGGIDPSKVNEHILHEKAHKQAADGAIGFRQSVYGLVVTGSSIRKTPVANGTMVEASFNWRPFCQQAGPLGEVTKLAVASIVAAPDEISEGDSARLIAMGYQGQEDIAQRIEAATDTRLSSLPMPETFIYR